MDDGVRGQFADDLSRDPTAVEDTAGVEDPGDELTSVANTAWRPYQFELSLMHRSDPIDAD
jgi:hypothetical protein